MGKVSVILVAVLALMPAPGVAQASDKQGKHSALKDIWT